MVRGQRSEENHRTAPQMTEWSRKVSASLMSLISAATFGWWVRIWCEHHENINPFCLVSSAQSAFSCLILSSSELSDHCSASPSVDDQTRPRPRPFPSWPQWTIFWWTPSSRMTVQVTKLQPSHTGFSQFQFTRLWCSPQSAVLISGEPLRAGDVDVQLMNLQQIVIEQKPLRNVCRTLLDLQEQ